MDIEKKVAVVHILVKRMREMREKRRPRKEWVRGTFQGREEKSAFVLFHYFN